MSHTKKQFTDALESKLHQHFNCSSCGKPFVNHDGVVRICAKLQAVQAELEALKKIERDRWTGWAAVQTERNEAE